MTSPGSHVSTVWARITDLQVVSGSGCRVVDTAGVEYLDFTAANAVASTGHAHPQVVAAIAEQAAKFVHAPPSVYTHDLLEPLAARLADITPGSIERFFFTSSNDEVIESAVKVAAAGVRTTQHRRVRRCVPRSDAPDHGDVDVSAPSTARVRRRSREACSSPRSPIPTCPIRRD